MDKKSLEESDLWQEWIKGVKLLPLQFRLTRIPVIGKMLYRSSFVGDPASRAWTVPVDEPIGDHESVHLPPEIVRSLIEQSAYRAKMPGCVCRETFECQDFPRDLGSLFLGRAFKDADQHGLIHLSVEEALAHAQQAVGLGLAPTIILERDIETAFGMPMNTGLAICFCCNCCCDWRLGLRLGSKEFRKKVTRPEGVSVVVGDACDLCGTCAQPEVCSVGAITLGATSSQIDSDVCVGCGACIQVCPNGAISFHLDPQVDIAGRLLAMVKQHADIT
jgi:UDP-glucose 4-epimerase